VYKISHKENCNVILIFVSAYEKNYSKVPHMYIRPKYMYTTVSSEMYHNYYSSHLTGRTDVRTLYLLYGDNGNFLFNKLWRLILFFGKRGTNRNCNNFFLEQLGHFFVVIYIINKIIIYFLLLPGKINKLLLNTLNFYFFLTINRIIYTYHIKNITKKYIWK
jgi:hypothetical protein